MLVSSYDHLLVMVSFFVAFIASFTALDIAARVATSQGIAALCWLVGGGAAMGIGIWSMHFIGMLAMMLPMPMNYDIPLTLTSMLVAMLASIGALHQVCRIDLPLRRWVTGSVLLASGVVVMHYTGMAALQVEPGIIWNPWLVALSVVIALVASAAALWLAFHLREGARHIMLLRGGAAAVMGLAIAGMHYTGMAAASFHHSTHVMPQGLGNQSLAVWVTVLTLTILGLTLLGSMLDAQVRASQLARSLAKANAELEKLALHDRLTNLPNRHLLEQRLEQAILKARETQGELSVMLMDLDGFKAVNDTWGHHIGDELLVAVTQRMTTLLHGRYTLARLGGDEFVLLVAAPINETGAIASALVDEISAPYSLHSYDLNVSLSIGIARFPEDGEDRQQLMLNADAAMYHTKRGGRNGWHFFHPSMNVIVQHKRQIREDLRLAIDSQQLRLFYQPKFRLPDGPIEGFEALLRWQHPLRGLLEPAEFLPHAEKSGQIVAIGHWVLDEACRQLRCWHQQGFTLWTVAVNLSALQFVQIDLRATVADVLQLHQIPPQSLILEVSEATAMRDPRVSTRIIRELRELGVQVAIDEFGIGYSNLLHLHRLPASELKVDRNFIHQIMQGEESPEQIRALIALAQSLNVRMVAGGVETPEQQQLLVDLGFSSLQGYLLGRPQPAETVLDQQGNFQQAPAQPVMPVAVDGGAI